MAFAAEVNANLGEESSEQRTHLDADERVRLDGVAVEEGEEALRRWREARRAAAGGRGARAEQPALHVACGRERLRHRREQSAVAMALRVRDGPRSGRVAHPGALPRRPGETGVAVAVVDHAGGEAAERRVAAHRGGERVAAGAGAGLSEERRGAHHRVVQR